MYVYIGRFQDDFVESRRVALERCLQKIVAHPMLYGDPDLKVFLESESFNVEVKKKKLWMRCALFFFLNKIIKIEKTKKSRTRVI